MHRLLVIALVIAAGIGVVLLRPASEFVHSGETMGTTYTVKCVTQLDAGQLQQLKADIGAALENVNRLMSTYRDDSDLSRLNTAPAGTWIEVDTATVAVVATAVGTSRETGGAFDPTVGPLVNLWGFGPPESIVEPPSESAILEARERIGVDQLRVREEPPALSFARQGMYLDLSAIAKGYGVDQIANLLEAAGIQQYMVEVGGEVRVRGRSLDRRPWRIGVERPTSESRAVHAVLELEDIAMATSGTYRHYFDSGGRRYSHTIDPRTGWPVAHDVVSATVLHPSCEMADALATGMIVLGVRDALALAERLSVAVLLLEERGEEIVEHRSTRFIERFGQAAS